jgi:hypothetical protein
MEQYEHLIERGYLLLNNDQWEFGCNIDGERVKMFESFAEMNGGFLSFDHFLKIFKFYIQGYTKGQIAGSSYAQISQSVMIGLKIYLDATDDEQLVNQISAWISNNHS